MNYIEFLFHFYNIVLYLQIVGIDGVDKQIKIIYREYDENLSQFHFRIQILIKT